MCCQFTDMMMERSLKIQSLFYSLKSRNKQAHACMQQKRSYKDEEKEEEEDKLTFNYSFIIVVVIIVIVMMSLET